MSAPIVFRHALSLSPRDLQKHTESFLQLLKREDLGFFRWPEKREEYARLIEVATSLRKKQTRLVVVGLGGSQTGGQCLVESIVGPNHNLEFWGEIDPQFLEAKLSSPLLDDTTFMIISKSGNTLEIAAMMNVINEKLTALGLSLVERSYVVTENRQNNPLRQWALAADVPLIDHPLDVGGRYSVFTPTGILPAVFAGVDVEQVRNGAQWVLTQEKLVVQMSAFFSELFRQKKSITVFWSYLYPLASFQKWLEQLWAESLGQAANRKGERTPVSTPLMVQGVSAQHSVLQQFSDGADDKGFLFFRQAGIELEGGVSQDSVLSGFEFLKSKPIGAVFHAESQAVEEALIQKGRHCASLEIGRVDAYTVGALLMLFQLVVGTLGEALNIDVFVQPGVEMGKKLALQKLKAQK